MRAWGVMNCLREKFTPSPTSHLAAMNYVCNAGCSLTYKLVSVIGGTKGALLLQDQASHGSSRGKYRTDVREYHEESTFVINSL